MNISAKMRRQGALYAIITDSKILKRQFIYQLMRISILSTLLLFTTLQLLFATSLNGQNIKTDRVTIGLKHDNLATALKKIEEQSSFRFYYRKADIKDISALNIPVITRTVEETLNELLSNTFFTFRQIEHNILLEKNSLQENYTIKGNVTSLNHLPVEFATISIKAINKDQILQKKLTDLEGNFQLTVKDKGDYLIEIKAVGMDNMSIAVTLADIKTIQLPFILLSANSRNLNEVTITGKKAYIEQKLDRTVINVGSLISNDGANALEVLEKSPGVLVDGNGTVSFKGKSGVTIFIDGKPTYLSGNNLAGYLKSLPASLLDQIELMDNPPAKYDAAGSAGVINIKTKKSKANGFNGSLSANYSRAHKGQTNESLNLNYRVNKINLFSSASYTLAHSYREFEEDRDYFDPNGIFNSAFRLKSTLRDKSNSSNIKMGMDYYQSAKTTWGIVLTGSVTPKSGKTNSTNELLNKNHLLDSVIFADNRSKGHFNNAGVNLNYSHQFDSLGKVITFDLDGLIYNSINNQQFSNQTYDQDGKLTSTQVITDHLPTKINIYSVKTDYTLPLGGKAKFEAGMKSSYIQTDNEANYFDVIDEVSISNPDFTNHFLYKENINAAYLNYSKVYQRFSFQAGLRAENTNTRGHQLGGVGRPDSSFTKSYTNLFPTTYLSYKLDSPGHHLLIASYGRRIRRPYYQDLNPFVTIVDKYSYFSGNPYLRPQYSDIIKLSYSYKSIITAALYYTHVADLQYEVVKQQGDVFIDGIGNIGTAKYLGASVTLAFNPVKWWLNNTYIQVFNNVFKGQLFSTVLDESRTMGEINLSNIFTLSPKWGAELSGFYVSKRANSQFINNGTGQLNAGVQKKVLNNKGSVKLSVRDLLKTYKNNGLTNNIPNATEAFRNQFNSRVFTVGFNYNFGSSLGKKNKRDTGSAELEKGRVKN